MHRLISSLLLLGCGASTQSTGTTYPTWEEAERQRDECGGATVAIQVDSIEIQNRGTRSQRMVLAARVLNSSDPAIADQLSTDQYVGGDAFMHEGERYIVATCSTEGLPQVIGWKPLVVGAIPDSDEPEESDEPDEGEPDDLSGGGPDDPI